MRVSVVIPAYNEEALLPECLRSLAAQDYAGEVEIIVVDNTSEDGTADVARQVGARVVTEPQRGYCNALRRGFETATGDIVATTDADTIVPRNWVSRIVREYEARPDVVAVGGEIVFCEPDRLARLFTRGILPVLNRLDRRNPAGAHLWGANFSVRRSAFDAAGGWSPRFNLQADTEISERLRAFGRVVLLEDLPVYTSSRRWNRSMPRSLFLYATNFVWFQTFHRPLWRTFPDIRDAEAAGEGAEAVAGVGAAASAGGGPGVGAGGDTSAVAARRPAWSRFGTGVAAGSLALFLAVAAYEAFAPWSSAFGTTYWNGATHRRVVALTFDDGPNDPYTQKVLDILKSEGVHATFFLVGENVRRYPATAVRIAREGHLIGNHSEHHPAGFALEPSSLLQREVEQAEATIHAVTGVEPRFFRPPQGIRSPWLMRVLARDSLVDVTWDDAPRDWLPASAADLVARTLAQAHPGAIILLHDGLNTAHGVDRSTTVQALPEIIHRLRAEGYRFVTLAELLGTPRARV